MPTSIEAQGHTVDEAIQIALNQLGVSRDKVEIEIVHHPRRGVLGIGARRAKVRATIRESVMLDGEEFDMSGDASLDDKPRRRRRRGGRTRGGARGEEGAEGGETPARGAGRPEAAREGTRADSGRGRDEGGRQRDGRRSDRQQDRQQDRQDERRDDRRGGRGRGGDRSADAQQRGGQQRGQQQGRGQGGRPDRAQDRDRQGQDRGQDRQGRQRGGDQRRERDDRGQRADRAPEPAAPEATNADRAMPPSVPPPSPEPVLSAPDRPEATAAPEAFAALPASRRAPEAEEPPLDAETLEAIRACAEELVRELLAKMGFTAEISSGIDEAAGEAVVSVHSDSEGLLIGRRGQTLDSLEHIINRMVLRGEAYVEGRIQLDIGDYRKRRRESLEELAGRLRARAVSEKRTVQVSPMSPRDRRYFSLAFAGDDAVEVRALGAGFYRRVIVAPAGMAATAGHESAREVDDLEDSSVDVGATSTLEAEH